MKHDTPSQITHLFSQHRLTEDYLVLFAEAEYLTEFLLDYKWRDILPQSRFGIKTLLSVLKTILIYRGVDRKMTFAWLRALAKAKRELRKNNAQNCDVAGRVPGRPPRSGQFGISV